jgi:hypothetical protein
MLLALRLSESYVGDPVLAVVVVMNFLSEVVFVEGDSLCLLGVSLLDEVILDEFAEVLLVLESHGLRDESTTSDKI